MVNGEWSMTTFKFLHAGYKGVTAFDGLSVVAAGAEAADRAVTLHTDHSLRHGEVEEFLLEVFVLVGHDEAEVHQRTVLLLGGADEELVAVNLAVDNLGALLGQFVHSLNAALTLNPAQVLQGAVDGHHGRCVEH